MATVTVKSGICKFCTKITTTPKEDFKVDVQFQTACPNYKPLEETFVEADVMDCCFGDKVGQGAIYDMMRPLCPHVSCPVPSAVLKAIEVGGGMALPGDVEMKIEK